MKENPQNENTWICLQDSARVSQKEIKFCEYLYSIFSLIKRELLTSFIPFVNKAMLYINRYLGMIISTRPYASSIILMLVIHNGVTLI